MTDQDQKTRIDYKPLARTLEVPRPPWWLAAAGFPVLLVLVIALLSSSGAETMIANVTQRVNLSIPALTLNAAAVETGAPASPLQSITLTVERGDSLAALFDRQQLSRTDLHAIMQLKAGTQRLRNLLPGDTIFVQANETGEILAMRMQTDPFNELRVARTADGFAAETVALPLQHRVTIAQGTIESSLFMAGMQAGLSDSLIMNLAGVFGWDIDFVQDLRVGDTFTVIYEELYRDGEKLADGNILAAEFVNSGQTFRAVRFTNAVGNSDYYTPEGKSVRKALMRNPIDFVRISSSFNPRRKHPVLNTIRAHRGVDYAAPTGTPIRSAGDGKITFRGRKGGYGNVIIIQHGGNYSTLYAHMSRFARGLGNGSRVRQNQVIGYVGSSGLANGPHLHYEVRVNGVHRNPRTVEMPHARPIDALYWSDFVATAQPLLKQLDLNSTRSAALLAAAHK